MNVQHLHQTCKNWPKSADLVVGMPFERSMSVKKSIGYRSLSLVAGIVVALIILLTLWFRQSPEVASTPEQPALSLLEFAESLTQKVLIKIPW